MMMPQPVASATPTGHVRINRRYRWIPTTTLHKIRDKEDEHRRKIILIADWKAWNKEAPIYDWDNRPVVSRANFVSSRRSVVTELGELTRRGCSTDARTCRSRSHSRTKSKYRSWQRNH